MIAKIVSIEIFEQYCANNIVLFDILIHHQS